MILPTNVKIGDLVNIPEIPSVIDTSVARDLDPADINSIEYFKELSQFFLITHDLDNIITIILQNIVKKSGKGFFITGSYGSGKSYLLTILSLLLKHKWIRKIVQNNHEKFSILFSNLDQLKILPVNIPLTEFQGDISLEEIIWDSIERTLVSENISLYLSHGKRFIQLFQKYIKPIHEKEIAVFFNNYLDCEFTWDRLLREDPSLLYTLCLKFINQNRLNIPFNINIDRRKILEELVETLAKSNMDGLIILIDELSEFLQSKPNEHLLNEDVRFLQFLGEKSSNLPIWIVGTLQDSIERTVKIHDSVFRKIKARYHYKLRLSSYHIRELITSRLIKKKKESEKEIRIVFDFLKSTFEDLKFSYNDFYQLYPVHPETITLLDINPDLFSRKRGIVEFVITQIRGKPDLNIKGLIEEGVTNLLTPDKIFDHFQDRLAESPDYSVFYRLYFEHFKPQIERTFQNIQDRNLAFNTVKLLILFALCPWKEERTLKELVNMLIPTSFVSDQVAKDIVYDLFHEKILKPLVFKIGHIKVIEAKTKKQNIYSIDVKLDPSKQLISQINELTSKLHPLSNKVLEVAYSNMNYGIFPCAMFYNKVVIKRNIKWQGTYRKILVCLTDLKNISSDLLARCRLDLIEGNIDLCLFIGILESDIGSGQKKVCQLFLLKEKKETLPGFVFWLPAMDSQEHFKVIADLFACYQIDRQLITKEKTNEIHPFLKSKIENLSHSSYKRVLTSYKNGYLLSSLGEIPVPYTQDIDNFDHWLELITNNFLSTRYPEHSKISPNKQISGKIILSKIINQFIIPGKFDFGEPGKDVVIGNLLKSALVPLGFAKQTKKGFLLHASPQYCQATNIVLKVANHLASNSPYKRSTIFPIVKLFKLLSKSPYGMSEPVFILAFISLARKGFVSLKDSTGLSIPLNSIELHKLNNYFFSQNIVLQPEFREIFFDTYKYFFNRNPSSYDINSQENLFRKIKTKIDKWTEEISNATHTLNELHLRFEKSSKKFPQIEFYITKLREIKNSLDEDIDTIKGLTRFFEELKSIGNFEDFFSNISKILVFIKSKQTTYIKINNYINDIKSSIPNEEKYSYLLYLIQTLQSELHISDTFILNDHLEECCQLFDQLLTEYKSIYIQEHSDREKWIMSIYNNQDINLENLLIVKRLQQIPYFPNINRDVDIDYFIQIFSEKPCFENPSRFLKEIPVCSCQYRLGQVTLEQKKFLNLKQNINSLCQKLLDMFLSPFFLDNLNEYKDKFPNGHIDIFISSLKNIDGSSLNMSYDFLKLLDDTMLTLFEKDFFRHCNIVKKNIVDFLEELSNQPLTPEIIKKRFNKWLVKDIDQNNNSIIIVWEK